MKIVVVKFSGDVPAEGWAIINYTTPEGGRTNIGHRFAEGDTWDAVAADFVTRMGAKPWPEFIRAKAGAAQVRLSCPDELDPSIFFGEYNPSPDQTEPHELHPAFMAIAEETF